jgi:uncharacterized protein (DUF433 family)
MAGKAIDMEQTDYSKIITMEPGKLGGKPCIRGHRFAVQHVFEYLASGMTEQELIAEFDFLTHEDLLACYAWAANVEKQIVYLTPQPT